MLIEKCTWRREAKAGLEQEGLVHLELQQTRPYQQGAEALALCSTTTTFRAISTSPSPSPSPSPSSVTAERVAACQSYALGCSIASGTRRFTKIRPCLRLSTKGTSTSPLDRRAARSLADRDVEVRSNGD